MTGFIQLYSANYDMTQTDAVKLGDYRQKKRQPEERRLCPLQAHETHGGRQIGAVAGCA
jgi:hypothetical protein